MNESAIAGGVFRQIVDQARDLAIFVLDERGVIELWNIGAERTFGWTADEIIGRSFDVLFTSEDRRVNMPDRELERARETGRSDDTRWHLRKDGRRVFVDGVTTRLVEGGFSKFSRDITDRYRSEQRLAAQLALTNLLNQDQSFATTARQIMQTICENLGWDIGALWNVEDDRIGCVDYWHASHLDKTDVRGLCENEEIRRGVGLVGEVWESGKALWVPDFHDTERFPRAAVAHRAGMVSAFAFPIVSQGRVTGAMEFFSSTGREPEQAMLPVMTLIGAQIGDFIARRRTEQALRDSESRYRLVSETAQDAIFTMNEHGVVTFVNRAVERMFGYKPEDLIGRTLDVIIPERLREAHRRGVDRYLRTRRRNIPWNGVELPALHKDGHEVLCEISFGEWTDGGQTIFTGFARDITDRQSARTELQETLILEQQARLEAEAARAQLQRRADEESAFRHLASALTGAVEMTEVLYEITNRATQVTRADGVYVERIVNSRTVEVVSSAGRGTPPRGLRVSFPGSLTDEILRGGQPVILAEMNEFGRSMAPYLADACGQCEVLVTPLVAENAPLGALVLLNSAASGRHFQDNDVVRARTLGDLTSLALRRVRLMEEEREAKEKAEAALRVRDETLGIVSHDLRNPLTKIALSADLLSDAAPGEQRELIENIRSSARQMQRLIQDLLDVARLEAGRLSVNARLVETGPLMREVCDTHVPIAQQKHQHIECVVPENLPRICADRDRLLQVFGNLIGNAIKFTPEGGTVTVEATAVPNAVQFVVSDTGPGIPEADLGKVFTPYWQAKKTAHMGAGLGLAIVKGIIDAHGGDVRAENSPAGGAMFTFTIPTE